MSLLIKAKGKPYSAHAPHRDYLLVQHTKIHTQDSVTDLLYDQIKFEPLPGSQFPFLIKGEGQRRLVLSAEPQTPLLLKILKK